MSRISHHFHAVFAMCVMGVSTGNLSGAAFSDDNWTTLTTSPLSPAPDGSFTFTDTNTPTGRAFYRAREGP